MTPPSAQAVFRRPDQNARFLSHGFARAQALDRPDLEVLLETWRAVASDHAGGFSSTLLSPEPALRRRLHLALLPWARIWAERALIDYRPIFCGFANKSPRTAGVLPLHQDITFTDESRRPAISLWMPLVDVDPTNGCLELIAASHRLNTAPRAPGSPFAGQAHEAALRQAYVRALPMAAGEALLMDQRLFHASGGNRSLEDRPAVTVVLVPLDQPVRYYHRVPADGSAELELFEVEADFLLDHQIGARPSGARPLDRLRETIDSISHERLAEILGAVASPQARPNQPW